MKTYRLKLTDYEFNQLTGKLLQVRNMHIKELNNAGNEEVKRYCQREINEVNEVFDLINTQNKTSF